MVERFPRQYRDSFRWPRWGVSLVTFAALAMGTGLAEAGAGERTSRGDTNVCEPPPPPPPEPACEKDCWLLSDLVLRGAVNGTLTFELRGVVRAKGEQQIPLFGPPSQVHIDEATIDGAKATIGFDGDHYYALTAARSFTLRGKITLGSDQILSVAGPVVSLETHLTKGRLMEGDRLSGLSNTVLHFDPMVEGEEGAEPQKPKAPPVFRLARSLRFGNETAFVYRLTTSQATDLGTVRLPLAYGEKVQDVQGSTGWQVEGGELLLPTTGHEAEITISGILPSQQGTKPQLFKGDTRSAYEWWLIESDPEHRVAMGGEPKLVETSQSPIPPTMPGARVYLVQRGQELEVDARSLVRGDVLAAVVRSHKRFVAITGRGELISDETIGFDNNGLDHLMFTPAGKAMYLSNDGVAARILHTEVGAADVLVPIRPGSHTLRVQSLDDVRLSPLAGAVAIPSSGYGLTTSTMDVTVGLPENVHPVAFVGGDRLRTALSREDVVAVLLGVAVACFGFRTRRTRILGALATAGLWFVSRDGFVVAASALSAAGAIFLASRFLRGNALLVASGGILVVALLGGRCAMTGATAEPSRDMFALDPKVPTPEISYGGGGMEKSGGLDGKTGITPVSLSVPTSERYVQSSRQLVTRERPFVPRILYVTSTLVTAMHVIWLALVAVLAWAHRDRLVALKKKVAERLARRPELRGTPTRSTLEAPPF